MKPSAKLMTSLMSYDMASGDIGTTINNIVNIAKFAKEAKLKVETIIREVRSAKDADPRWTDDEICQVVLDNLPLTPH